MLEHPIFRLLTLPLKTDESEETEPSHTPFFLSFLSIQAQSTKAWTRWWWMGSAVNKEGIKYQLEAFHRAGIGGVEITPIYGVKCQEANFLPFLSPQYLEMLEYTTMLADSLCMRVDTVLGTGWSYGGAQVEPQHAATKLEHQVFDLKAGDAFDQTLVHKWRSGEMHRLFSNT